MKNSPKYPKSNRIISPITTGFDNNYMLSSQINLNGGLGDTFITQESKKPEGTLSSRYATELRKSQNTMTIPKEEIMEIRLEEDDEISPKSKSKQMIKIKIPKLIKTEIKELPDEKREVQEIKIQEIKVKTKHPHGLKRTFKRQASFKSSISKIDESQEIREIEINDGKS